MATSTDDNDAIVNSGKFLVRLIRNHYTRFEKPSKCAKLQLWKYDPSYFEKNGVVDPVSLACMFKGNEDERIGMLRCIEKSGLPDSEGNSSMNPVKRHFIIGQLHTMKRFYS